MEVYTCDSESYVICRNLAFLMLDLETGICRKLAFRCPKMAESRNEKTSQNTGFARFGGILSGFVRIRSEPAGARTQDPNIKSVVLYLLSYGFSGTITAQTVLVVQMYGIYLKIQYPKTFFSCEAPYGFFFRSCSSCHRSGRTLFGHCGPVKLHPLQPPHGIASIIGTKAQLRNP